MSRKILIISQYFDPEPNILKGLGFAKFLKKNNYDVEVVTTFPSYPIGKFYPGFTPKIIEKKYVDEILVTRLLSYPSHDNSVLRRSLTYASFAFSAFIYCLFFMKKKNIIYAYHPPISTGVIAVFINILRKIPVVYDIQDLWPDTLCATNIIKYKFIIRFINIFCNFVYRNVDHIVVLSKGFKKILIKRKVNLKKISVIYNWADEEKLKFEKNNNTNDRFDTTKFNITYAGNIGNAQELNVILKTANLLKKRIQKYFLI